MSEATQDTAIKEERFSHSADTYLARAYAAQSPSSGMAPFTVQRRLPRPQDMQIDILYCGVCRSDLP